METHVWRGWCKREGLEPIRPRMCFHSSKMCSNYDLKKNKTTHNVVGQSLASVHHRDTSWSGPKISIWLISVTYHPWTFVWQPLHICRIPVAFSTLKLYLLSAGPTEAVGLACPVLPSFWVSFEETAVLLATIWQYSGAGSEILEEYTTRGMCAKLKRLSEQNQISILYTILNVYFLLQSGPYLKPHKSAKPNRKKVTTNIQTIHILSLSAFSRSV